MKTIVLLRLRWVFDAFLPAVKQRKSVEANIQILSCKRVRNNPMGELVLSVNEKEKVEIAMYLI